MGRTHLARASIKELQKRIQTAEERKKYFEKYLHELWHSYQNGLASRGFYVETAHRHYNGKTLKEWISFYEHYIKECEALIRKHKTKIIKGHLSAFIFSVFIIVFLLGLSFYIRPQFTGLFVQEPVEIPEITTQANVIINTTQHQAVLNQRVKWTKTISLDEPATAKIRLPSKATNISVEKITDSYSEQEGVFQKQTSPFQEESLLSETGFLGKIGRLTGGVIGTQVSEEKIIKILENSTNYQVEYETPAPTAIEETTDRGKKIQISSPDEIHYENVLAFTSLDESLNIKNPKQVKIYWRENNTYLSPSSVQDTNNNGVYDYIEWIAPSLSEQTFDIIVITKAEHLNQNREFISDIYEEVKALDGIWSEEISDKHYARVVFEKNLTKENDITLYPSVVSGNPKIEVYEKDGNKVIAEFKSLNSNQYNKIFLDGSSGAGLRDGYSQDIFDLKILDGSVEFDHIIDPVSSNIPWWTEGGQVTLAASTTTSVDLSQEVNTSKTFILLSRRAGSSQDEPSDSGAYAQWVNGTRFDLIKSSSEAGAIYVWNVIEGNDIYVQNGTQTYAATQTSFNILINSVNISRTVAFMNFGSCDSTTVGDNNEIFWKGNVTNSTNLNITRLDGSACDGSVGYFVVEFNDGSTIQSGEIANVGATASPSFASVSTINQSDTWFYFSSAFNSTATGLDDTSVIAEHVNTTAFRVSRAVAGGTARVQWYAISTPNSYVQYGLQAPMT